MPRSAPRLLLLLATASAACTDTSTGPTPPGAVRIAIQVAAGGIPDTNGYRIDVDGHHVAAPTGGGLLVVSEVTSGPQVVSLADIDPWCQASSASRSVAVVPSDTVDVIFSITCGEIPWPLTIITQEVGVDRAGQYTLHVTGMASRSIFGNDTVTMQLPTGGDPEIRLSLVPGNCWPADTFPRRYRRGLEPTTITLRIACGVIATMLRDSTGASGFVLLNLGDGRVRPLPMVTYHPSRVEWQSYGRRLVLQGSGRSLDVLDLATGILTRRINGDVSFGDTDTLAYGATWYGVGNDLLVSASRPTESTRLWLLKDNTVSLSLPPDGLAQLPDEYEPNRRGSAGGRIALTAKVNGEWVLRIKTPDSTYTILNDVNPYSSPAWGGTGVYVSRVTSVDWGYTNAIWRVGVDGTDPVQVTAPAPGEFDTDPFFSYFGDFLYFTRHPANGVNPYLMQMRVSSAPVVPVPVTFPAGTPFGPGSSGN